MTCNHYWTVSYDLTRGIAGCSTHECSKCGKTRVTWFPCAEGNGANSGANTQDSK